MMIYYSINVSLISQINLDIMSSATVPRCTIRFFFLVSRPFRSFSLNLLSPICFVTNASSLLRRYRLMARVKNSFEGHALVSISKLEISYIEYQVIYSIKIAQDTWLVSEVPSDTAYEAL